MDFLTIKLSNKASKCYTCNCTHIVSEMFPMAFGIGFTYFSDPKVSSWLISQEASENKLWMYFIIICPLLVQWVPWKGFGSAVYVYRGIARYYSTYIVSQLSTTLFEAHNTHCTRTASRL